MFFGCAGLRDIPYYWAGVFVLEAARFLFPKQHFALIDNDCVPVTLFESGDLSVSPWQCGNPWPREVLRKPARRLTPKQIPPTNLR